MRRTALLTLLVLLCGCAGLKPLPPDPTPQHPPPWTSDDVYLLRRH